MPRKFGEQQVCRKVAEESSVRKLSQRKDEVVQCRLYYTDAAEAAAFEPSTCQQKAARVCYGAEDLQDKQVAAGRSDINARDFIMRRFLPAAQAMATEAPLTAAATTTTTTAVRESDFIPTSGRRSIPLLPLQQQLTGQQVANDVRGAAQVHQDSENLSLRTSCGFPLKLGWPPFRHLLGFQTSKSSSTKHHAPPSSSEKLPHDQRSFNSDDLFWSDEVKEFPPPHQPIGWILDQQKCSQRSMQKMGSDAIIIMLSSFLNVLFCRNLSTKKMTPRNLKKLHLSP